MYLKETAGKSGQTTRNPRQERGSDAENTCPLVWRESLPPVLMTHSGNIQGLLGRCNSVTLRLTSEIDGGRNEVLADQIRARVFFHR